MSLTLIERPIGLGRSKRGASGPWSCLGLVWTLAVGRQWRADRKRFSISSISWPRQPTQTKLPPASRPNTEPIRASQGFADSAPGRYESKRRPAGLVLQHKFDRAFFRPIGH